MSFVSRKGERGRHKGATSTWRALSTLSSRTSLNFKSTSTTTTRCIQCTGQCYSSLVLAQAVSFTLAAASRCLSMIDLNSAGREIECQLCHLLSAVSGTHAHRRGRAWRGGGTHRQRARLIIHQLISLTVSSVAAAVGTQVSIL